MNHQGYLPEFVTITEGNVADITIGRVLEFPKESIIVMDRGYNDHLWYKRLKQKGTCFVMRLKRPEKYRVVEQYKVDKSTGLTSDQTIRFVSKDKPYKCMQQILRLLQLNLFEKRDLMALLRGDPPNRKQHDFNQMMML